VSQPPGPQGSYPGQPPRAFDPNAPVEYPAEPPVSYGMPGAGGPVMPQMPPQPAMPPQPVAPGPQGWVAGYPAVMPPGGQPGMPGGWPYPGAPVPAEPGATEPAGKNRKKWFIVGATVLVIALVGGGIGIYQVFFSGARDRDAINTAAVEFTRAAAAGDAQQVRDLLCEQEAAAVPSINPPAGASVEPADDLQVVVGTVEVRDDVGSAAVTKGSDSDVTLYFRKESDKWTVCASAEDDFTAAK
jgi:hypothetical protein